jgi:hypothetical protein
MFSEYKMYCRYSYFCCCCCIHHAVVCSSWVKTCSIYLICCVCRHFTARRIFCILLIMNGIHTSTNSFIWWDDVYPQISWLGKCPTMTLYSSVTYNNPCKTFKKTSTWDGVDWSYILCKDTTHFKFMLSMTSFEAARQKTSSNTYL